MSLIDAYYDDLTPADWRKWWDYYHTKWWDSGNPALYHDKSGMIHVRCIDCKGYIGSEESLGYHRAIRTMRCKECAAAKRRFDDACRKRFGRHQAREQRKLLQRKSDLDRQEITLLRDVIREQREEIEKTRALLQELQESRTPRRDHAKGGR